MPIYEYECKKCGHVTEAWQSFSSPPLSKCELCNGKVKKLISQSTFHLKGSGWYVTDYASKRKNTGKNESPKKESDTKEKKSASEKKESSSTKSEKASKK
jgi:putative FmdB family regulatory protein